MKRISRFLVAVMTAVLAIAAFPSLSVRADADKAGLQAARDAVTAAIAAETTYWEASYAAFEADLADLGGLAAVDVVLADPLAEQVDVDAMAAALAALVDGLVAASVHDQTVLVLTTARAVGLAPYTPASSAAYTAALDLVEAAIGAGVRLGDAGMSALEDDVEAAAALLVLRADKTELELLNNAAIIAFYEEREAYTTSSHQLFRDAVIAYGTYLAMVPLIADADATQAEVDAAEDLIAAALALLVPVADVDALRSALNAAEAVDLASYTPASVALYNAGLIQAEAVIADDDTDQAEADAAVAALLALPAVLVPQADKTALLAAVEDGESVRRSIYSNSSYQILARLLQTAATVLEDADASQTETDELVAAIRTAIGGLRVRVSEIIIREDTGAIDIDQYVVLGDAAVDSYLVADPAVAAVDADGNLTGLRHGTTTVTVLLTNGVIEELTIVVKAKIVTATMILTIVLPVVATIAAAILLLTNDKAFRLPRQRREGGAGKS